MASTGIAALVALAVTGATVPAVLALAGPLGLVDKPNERSSHVIPTPRGGGIACALGLLVGLAVAAPVDPTVRKALVFAVVAFGLVGLVDDLRGVPQILRAAIHAALAGLSLVWLLDGLGGPPAWRVVFGAGCLIWLVAYVNVFNQMDGINGISVAQAVVAGGAWAIVGDAEHVSALLVGGPVVAAAALGFLPYNFPGARIFLGDVGSHVLGAWMAVLAVLGMRAGIAPEAVLAPLSLYMVDTVSTACRRIREVGPRFYLPHRTHTYQRLTSLGWSHARTTGFVAALMALCSALGLVSLGSSIAARVVADLLAVAVLAFYAASPWLRSPARRARRRATS